MSRGLSRRQLAAIHIKQAQGRRQKGETEMTEKQCQYCEQLGIGPKPVAEFPKGKTKDGYDRLCREHSRAWHKGVRGYAADGSPILKGEAAPKAAPAPKAPKAKDAALAKAIAAKVGTSMDEELAAVKRLRRSPKERITSAPVAAAVAFAEMMTEPVVEPEPARAPQVAVTITKVNKDSYRIETAGGSSFKARTKSAAEQIAATFGGPVTWA